VVLCFQNFFKPQVGKAIDVAEQKFILPKRTVWVQFFRKGPSEWWHRPILVAKRPFLKKRVPYVAELFSDFKPVIGWSNHTLTNIGLPVAAKFAFHPSSRTDSML
jgi:hypothetical protein